MVYGPSPHPRIRRRRRSDGVRSLLVLLLVLFACARERAPSALPSTQTGTGGWSDADRVTGVVDHASCRADAAALSLVCELQAAAAGEVRWFAADRTAVTTPSGTLHEVVLWGMPTGEQLAWRAEVVDSRGEVVGEASGTLPSLEVPPGLLPLRLTVEGDPVGVPPVLFRSGCPGQPMGWVWVDATGRVRGSGAVDDSVQAVAFDGLDGVLTVAGRERVVYEGLGGEARWTGSGTGDPLHHDVHRDDQGLTWVLTASVVDDVVSDGLLVFDDTGAVVASWSLADHFEPGPGRLMSAYWATAFPGVNDWSHGNSVSVSDGLALLSLRWLDAVVAIDARLDSPGFGDVEWVLTGREGELDSDFDWVDGGSFVGQHHATWTVDGDLQLFDNRLSPERSRVVQLAVDPAASSVSERRSWLMEAHCEVLGGAYELADGSVLATCGPGAVVHRFVPGIDEPVWTMSAACSTGLHRAVPRFVPMPGVLAEK